jgi:hypothetical protein
MATLYKPQVVSYVSAEGKYRTPDGRRINKSTPGAVRIESESPTWWGRYTDVNGTEHQVKLSRNKDIARRMLAKLAGDAQLESVGIPGDQYADHRARPLSEHVEDFARVLRAKGSSAKQVGQVTSRVSKVLAGCGFTRVLGGSASHAIHCPLSCFLQPFTTANRATQGHWRHHPNKKPRKTRGFHI